MTIDLPAELVQQLEAEAARRGVPPQRLVVDLLSWQLAHVDEGAVDTVVQLKQSPFVGCFEAEPELAENTESVLQDLAHKAP